MGFPESDEVRSREDTPIVRSWVDSYRVDSNIEVTEKAKKIIYYDGKFMPQEKARIPVTTHALHYGTGCFEGIRAYFSEKEKALFVFRLQDHFKRFQNSCKLLFIDLGLSIEELSEITIQLLKKNFTETDIYIRPLAFKSDPAIGNFSLTALRNSLVIYTIPLGRYLNTEIGIKAKISSWDRVSDNTIPPRAKITGAYVNTSLAKTEALLLGYDEALLMDRHGHLVEGGAENLFIVKDNVVITPPSSDDILLGITRQTIIQICEEQLHLKVVERSIDRAEIYTTDEVFLVGTGAEVSPVIKVDFIPIGDGKVGQVTGQVKKLYFDIVHGKNPKYVSWLTKVKA